MALGGRRDSSGRGGSTIRAGGKVGEGRRLVGSRRRLSGGVGGWGLGLEGVPAVFWGVTTSRDIFKTNFGFARRLRSGPRRQVAVAVAAAAAAETSWLWQRSKPSCRSRDRLMYKSTSCTVLGIRVRLTALTFVSRLLVFSCVLVTVCRDPFSRRSTRHAAGRLLWLAATAVGHQGIPASAAMITARRAGHASPRQISNDRGPPPPASPCLHLRQRLRLASPCSRHAHARARRPRSLAKQASPRVSNREPKAPGSNRERFDHRRWRYCKGTQGQCLI